MAFLILLIGTFCTQTVSQTGPSTCYQVKEYKFMSMNQAIRFFSKPGISSTSDQETLRGYLSHYLQKDGTVITRNVP